MLLVPHRPQILLLEDIEHGLHPLAQKQLVEVIGQILQEKPDLQVLATAHSPYLLNYVRPEQVRIMAVGDDGYARCGQLSDHPKFATWKRGNGPRRNVEPVRREWLARGGGSVSLQFAVVYEALADFQTATELADRVLVESIDSMEKDLVEHHWTWVREASGILYNDAREALIKAITD